MSSHNQIDERFDELVSELRSGRVAASPELRERVRTIAAQAPEPTRRRPFLEHFSWRRAVLVAAPACVIAGVGAAMLHGFTSSGSQPTAADQAMKSLEVQRKAPRQLGAFERRAPAGGPRTAQAPGAPPPSTRLQDYRVNMRVRVSGNDALSRATTRAMQVTRSLGGYVASVQYSTPSVRDGDAVLILRVPVRNIQRAVLAYTGLGTLVAQNFSVIDLQKRHDAELRRIAGLRVQIAKLEARLVTEALTDVDRAHVREQLENVRASLVGLTATHRTTVNRARLATARLSLTTFHPKEKNVIPAAPSRFDRMLDDAGNVLAHELVGVGYAFFLAGPFLLLGLLLAAAERSRRRRAERRLLAATR